MSAEDVYAYNRDRGALYGTVSAIEETIEEFTGLGCDGFMGFCNAAPERTGPGRVAPVRAPRYRELTAVAFGQLARSLLIAWWETPSRMLMSRWARPRSLRCLAARRVRACASGRSLSDCSRACRVWLTSSARVSSRTGTISSSPFVARADVEVQGGVKPSDVLCGSQQLFDHAAA